MLPSSEPFVNSGNTVNKMGRSPGLEVMEGDSCSKGRDFESRRHILDGHFFTFICSKNCNVCLKDENKIKKRPRLAQFY